jgi:hypothetical protein
MPYREGQTATNPQTGQTIVFRGGQWVSAAPQGGMGGPTRKLSASDTDFLRDQRDAANKAAAAVRATDAFMAINRKQGTGQLRGVPIIGPIINSFSAPHQEMEGLTEGMIPGMKVPGSGTFTDADMISARKAVPNVMTLGPANAGRANFLRQNAKDYSDYVNFMEDWAQKRGNLLGAQKAWEASKAQRQAPRPSAPQRSSQPATRARNNTGARILSVED